MTAIELTPILNVSDWQAAADWFEQVGFRRGFEWRDDPEGPITFGAVLWGETVEVFLCLDAARWARRARCLDGDLRR